MTIEIQKAGKKSYRLWEKRTPAEKYRKEHSILVKVEDSKQAERLLRKIERMIDEGNT